MTLSLSLCLYHFVSLSFARSLSLSLSLSLSYSLFFFSLSLSLSLSVLQANAQRIADHNARGESYTLGFTEFADMTFEEFKRDRLMATAPQHCSATAGTKGKQHSNLYLVVCFLTLSLHRHVPHSGECCRSSRDD